MCGGDGDGGYGGGFGAEDAWAEGDGRPYVLSEESYFFGSPAAFGADGEGEIGGLLGWWSVYIPPIALPPQRATTARWGPRRLRWMGHPDFVGATSEMRGFFAPLRMTIQFPSMGRVKIL
jgi:hypothetical protein